MDFAAGWVGGVCGVLVSHPLDNLRTKQVVSGKSWLHTLRSTGINLSLYQGVLSPCVSVGVWKAVTLGTHHRLQKLIAGTGTQQLPLWKVTLTACLSGMISACVCTPFDLIKSRTMLDRAQDRGILAALRAEIKQLRQVSALPGGMSRNLFRGMPLMVARDSYATGVFLGSYEMVHRWATRPGDWVLSNLQAAVVAGSVAGPLGWIVCYPVEVTKIHWQTDRQWKSVSACVSHIYATGGLRAFFRGLPLCCARAGLQIPTTMIVFEYLHARGNPMP